MSGTLEFHQISLIRKLPLPWWEGVGGGGFLGNTPVEPRISTPTLTLPHQGGGNQAGYGWTLH